MHPSGIRIAICEISTVTIWRNFTGNQWFRKLVDVLLLMKLSIYFKMIEDGERVGE